MRPVWKPLQAGRAARPMVNRGTSRPWALAGVMCHGAFVFKRFFRRQEFRPEQLTICFYLGLRRRLQMRLQTRNSERVTPGLEFPVPRSDF